MQLVLRLVIRNRRRLHALSSTVILTIVISVKMSLLIISHALIAGVSGMLVV